MAWQWLHVSSTSRLTHYGLHAQRGRNGYWYKARVSLSQKRAWGERLILGAKSVILNLDKRGIVLRHIVAHSFTPEGIRLMRHIGFTETPPKAPGLHDFLIDVENSGLSFILEYKDALRQWQKEHEKQSNHENLLLPSKEKTKAIG